eukprot:CAMPEP_0170308006 /NCGR_PEP_ID=MMETSP0116_2-20130129/54434_1 /TAXON_ID=400756 /ORGANISM="Durinskia baltica, Strain CSIRO CS-38" /LENGTH=269 /DNA_ID=CAMNT_0010560171 /DNA_START=27 /DNA_END=836 /DNA_ORIENTATION=+
MPRYCHKPNRGSRRAADPLRQAISESVQRHVSFDCLCAVAFGSVAEGGVAAAIDIVAHELESALGEVGEVLQLVELLAAQVAEARPAAAFLGLAPNEHATLLPLAWRLAAGATLPTLPFEHRLEVVLSSVLLPRLLLASHLGVAQPAAAAKAQLAPWACNGVRGRRDEADAAASRHRALGQALARRGVGAPELDASVEETLPKRSVGSLRRALDLQVRDLRGAFRHRATELLLRDTLLADLVCEVSVEAILAEAVPAIQLDGAVHSAHG